MLIHLPDETAIIEVIKFAASIGCDIQHSSANVLRFNKREQSNARKVQRVAPSNNTGEVKHG